MIRRYATSAAVAGVVTFGLFYLMQYLVGPDRIAEIGDSSTTLIDIGRVERESDIERKRRLPDRAKAREQPPPPPITAASAPRPQASDLQVSPFDLDAGLNLVSPDLGGAPSDADTVPLVRVPPVYPPRAQERGVEGWVLLEFSITPVGAVSNVQVVDSDPPHIFNRAAMRAVRKWKYKPKIENGEPVERHGVQTIITFELEA